MIVMKFYSVDSAMPGPMMQFVLCKRLILAADVLTPRM